MAEQSAIYPYFTSFIVLCQEISEKQICQIIIFQNLAYDSQKGVFTMKEKLHAKNTFKTTDLELLKKAVTTKVEKIVNIQVKKQADVQPVNC